jgi:hypothetical protein
MIISKFSPSFLQPHMNKLKTLKKKIRRLEARQQKGAKKLAKLKQKLGAAAAKTKSKASPEKAAKKKQPTALKAQAKPTAPPKVGGVAKKAKRKVNLTPERRAQLAAAMRARWAAKRAAAANTQNTSSSPGASPGDASQPR